MQVAVFGFLGDGAGRSPVDVYVDELARAHDEGFPRMWTAQLPREPDLLVTLAVALREVPEIKVGTGVLPIQVEHPMAMAQRALTVNLISGGRPRPRDRAQPRAVTEGVWGVPWDRTIRRLGEYLDGLLPLLAAQEGDAVGEIVTTRGGLRIPDAPTPDVYVAALGPRCCGSPDGAPRARHVDDRTPARSPNTSGRHARRRRGAGRRRDAVHVGRISLAREA